MCGYSTEDFLTYLKEDSRINIVQEDIPYVMNTAMKALENNIPINVVYRIYTKDRQQIMIRLDGTVMSDVTVKEDDIAIIYAVHTRVSNDAIEMMQEQKRYRMLLDNFNLSDNAIYPEDAHILQQFEETKKNRKPKSQITLRLKTKDETYRWTEIMGFFEYDSYQE